MNQQELDNFRTKVAEACQADMMWAVDPAMIFALVETVIRLQRENEALRTTLAELQKPVRTPK